MPPYSMPTHTFSAVSTRVGSGEGVLTGLLLLGWWRWPALAAAGWGLLGLLPNSRSLRAHCTHSIHGKDNHRENTFQPLIAMRIACQPAVDCSTHCCTCAAAAAACGTLAEAGAHQKSRAIQPCWYALVQDTYMVVNAALVLLLHSETVQKAYFFSCCTGAGAARLCGLTDT